MQDVEHRTLASTLFHLLSDEEWESLRTQMDQRTFKAGELLLEQGAMAPSFHVIVDGTASVVATNQHGQRHELGRLGFGECVGEMSLLTGEPASADVVAVTAVTTYGATQATLTNMGTLRSRLIEALSAILAGRLKHANERLLALHPADIHMICCGPGDLPALSRLPGAISSAVSAPVLALLSGERMAAAAQGASLEAPGVRVSALDPSDRLDLRALLPRLSHDYGHVLIFGEQTAVEPQVPDIASLLHVIAEGGRSHSANEHIGGGQLIVIGPQRWTQPSLRQLGDRFGAPVVGVLPARAPSDGARTPTARLARVMTHRQVGLALGAGAAKGLAHIGVLRALAKLDVGVDVVSGCSIGSAIAAGWASGLNVEELTETVAKIASRAIRPTLPLRSFLSSKGIRDELMRAAGDRRLEDLDIPVSIVATDLYRRSEVVFTSGLAWPRILASMAMPGVYPAVAAMGSYLVDGGILSPVPVRQCRDLGAGIVIGVRLTGKRTSPREELDFKPSQPLAVETISRSMEIMHNRISEMTNVQADVTVEVCIEGGGMRDFRNGEPIISEGEKAMLEARQALHAVMPYVQAEAA
jgi:NTE family protein